MIITGTTASGERLNFELWAYHACRYGNCTDPLILDAWRRCVRFDTEFHIPGVTP